MITRRQFISSLAGLGFTGFSGTAYARFVEPKWLENSKVHIDLPNKTLKKPIRLLHVSDFHISGFVPPSFIEKAVDLGLSNNPDLICITGDFITGFIQHYQRYKGILQRLSGFAPTYACLGNHDGGIWAEKWGGYSNTSEVVQLLRKSRITCLQNQSQIIELNKQKLCIIGLGDIWAGESGPNAPN